MCRQADAANVPSAVAISLVFGGCTGTLIAAAFGLGAGAGFVAGACLVFLFVWATLLRRRPTAAGEQEQALAEPDGARPLRTAARVQSAP
jgi:predicted MFS family arabinose efflux permease